MRDSRFGQVHLLVVQLSIFPLVFSALANASFFSAGRPLVLKALANASFKSAVRRYFKKLWPPLVFSALAVRYFKRRWPPSGFRVGHISNCGPYWQSFL